MGNFANFFLGKKILLVGLGQLGGGLAMARFLCENGARLTVTDTKTKLELKETIKQLTEFEISYSLGGHKKSDFASNDVIVFNQAVSIFTPWAKLALKLKKEIYNNYTLFLKLTGPSGRQIIALTGTRGKTTTAAWIAHIIEGSVTGGNTPDADLFKIISHKAPKQSPFVLEVPSFQLEFANAATRPSQIAIITNLFPDHLNRYNNMATYAAIKAKIFLNQGPNDFLVLNAENKSTSYFLSQNPKSQIYFFSRIKLARGRRGLFCQDDNVFFSDGAKIIEIFNVAGLSEHEKENLMAAALGAHLFGVSFVQVSKKIKNLPSIPLRQQIVKNTPEWLAVNDSAATSPDATIAAIDKFSRNGRSLLLICGGTDKNLEFSGLAKKIKKTLPEDNVFLLSGSATDKLIAELSKANFFQSGVRQFSSLEKIFSQIKKSKSLKKTLLFSPGAASFEKFKNEFDRGDKFNGLIEAI